MPSPFLGARLKALRTERGWSQADLATRIDSDARQVSRYENSRISPSLEDLVRIAETLDITVDYLVVETATRRLEQENEVLRRAADEPQDRVGVCGLLLGGKQRTDSRSGVV